MDGQQLWEEVAPITPPLFRLSKGSSERNISAIIPEEHYQESVRAVHRAFFECNKRKIIPLYIAGYGSVGRELAELIERAVNLGGSKLYYETTAETALSLLKTIRALRGSGEEIVEIEAILSGSLNWLCSNYQPTNSTN